MYKIYINERPLVLISSKEAKKYPYGSGILRFPYPGKPKFLLNYLDFMEKNSKFDEVVLFSDDEKAIFKDLKTVAKPVKAAGGIVKNDKGELLTIYRRGFWDLPKGHIDKGEKKRETAYREVKEETGIRTLKVFDQVGITYHLFKTTKWKLKISYWYSMHSNQIDLIPEVREDIFKAKWIAPDDFLRNYTMYASIRDLLTKRLRN